MQEIIKYETSPVRSPFHGGQHYMILDSPQELQELASRAKIGDGTKVSGTYNDGVEATTNYEFAQIAKDEDITHIKVQEMAMKYGVSPRHPQ